MKFNTLLEGMPVEVYWMYEADEKGIYDSYVESVIFRGVNVSPILSEEVLYELDAEAHKVFKETNCD